MNVDTILQHDVMAELEWDPRLQASRIGVAAQDGVVTLTGTVSSYADKLAAERAAKRVYGVKAVADDIEVQVPGDSERTDADIGAAAVYALRWHTSIPDGRVQVTVRNGWLTLEGTVNSWYQLQSAQRVLCELRGVKGVANHVRIRSGTTPTDLKERIEAALKRNAGLDARRVRVDAMDGKVILRGNVRSWAERAEAEQVAWAAPGVIELENHLAVTP
jgi:osmotically-inducible protein OsmY